MKLPFNVGNILPLVIIFFLAVFLRVVNIDQNPPALYGDELTLVYDAYSILKTGHDQTGAFMPLTFSMSDGRPGGYVYFSLPFIALFGPTEVAARLLSVISGVGIVVLIFLFGRYLFSEKVGVIGGFLTAVLPWDLSLSRGGFEAHFALFLFMLGLVIFLRAKNNPWLYILSASAFGLTLHTYHSYKVTTPLFLILLLFSFVSTDLKRGIVQKRNVVKFLGVFAIFLVVWLIQVFQGTDIRYKSVNVFTDTKIENNLIQKVNSERQINILPSQTSSLFHNKYVEYSSLIGRNYFNSFSIDFLFLSGDGNPRHNPAESGGLLLVQLLLIPFGLIKIVISNNRKLLILLVGWVLIAPLATSITSAPHAIRSSLMIPPLVILSALGAVTVISLSRRTIFSKILLVVIVLGIFFQLSFILERFYFLSPNKYCNFWSCAAKEASLIALHEKEKYKYVIVSDKIDNSEHAFPVYAQISPQTVAGQYQEFTPLGRYRFKKFDNVYVGSVLSSDVKNFLKGLDGPSLYIGDVSEMNYISGYQSIEGRDKTTVLVVIKKINLND